MNNNDNSLNKLNKHLRHEVDKGVQKYLSENIPDISVKIGDAVVENVTARVLEETEKIPASNDKILSQHVSFLAKFMDNKPALYKTRIIMVLMLFLCTVFLAILLFNFAKNQAEDMQRISSQQIQIMRKLSALDILLGFGRVR